MCTAITFKTNDHYFGRTLDMCFSYDGPKVIITTRNFKLKFRKAGEVSNHFAIIGIGIERDEYPLYFDATNEKGLSVAGLNFPENCVYSPISDSKLNISPFELIPWILGQFERVEDVCKALKDINIANIPFDKDMPCSPLHWIVADRNRSITVENTKQGLHIYENKVGVLTNNPPFDMQMWNLVNYMNITSKCPENRLSKEIHLEPYSYGVGGIGLPGDLSSASRFVRAAFVKFNSVCEGDEISSVSQFFHILNSVEQQKGCAEIEEGKYQTTLYTSCCNTDKGIYYYNTYDNHRISAVSMGNENLDDSKLIQYSLITQQQIKYQN